MNQRELSQLASEEEHLFNVLHSERFLRMEGLSNEIPHFIYDFAPAWTTAVYAAKDRIIRKLTRDYGIRVSEINLYQLCVERLKQRRVWDRIMEMEPSMPKAELFNLLQNILDPEKHLAPAIAEKVEQEDAQIVFLTGVGEVYPFIRSHTVLNNLQSVINKIPLLMFFPGRYEVSSTQGSALVLFGQLKDDSFYRAKRILDQEV